MEIVKLLIVDIDLANSYHHFLMKSLNDEQKEKAFRFKNEKDQMRCLLSSYLISQLSKEELQKNETGKPYYPNGPFFNISHSGKYVIMANTAPAVISALNKAVEEMEAAMKGMLEPEHMC